MRASWDLNNNQTTYTYDSVLRPLQINPPDGGQTAFTYDSATSTTENRKITASQTFTAKFLLDALGRMSQQQVT